MNTDEMSVDELEQAVIEKWGNVHYRDWCMVQSGNPTRWVWFCGTGESPTGWLHKGYADTIREALTGILTAGEE